MHSNLSIVGEDLLPYEEAVIGGILIKKEIPTEVRRIIPSADAFCDHKLQEIYQAMLELDEVGMPIDFLLLRDQLLRNGNLDSIGGEIFLSDLSSRVPTSANLEQYAHLVLESNLDRDFDNRLQLEAERFRRGETTRREVAESIADAQSGAVLHTPKTSWPDPVADAALHGLAGDVVRQLEPHTEADPVGLLVSFLTMVGNAFGTNAYMQTGGDRQFPRLFTVLVGETAKGRKGSSLGYIRMLMSIADPSSLEREATGLSSGEGVIYSVRDKIEKYDAKNGATKVVDPGETDKRRMIIEGEFAIALKVMQREGNTLSATLRAAWDSGNLRILNKNSPLKATDAHICIIAHVTKVELLRLLHATDSANGFANRFNWCCVRRSKVLPYGGNPDEINFQMLGKRIAEVIRFAKTGGRMKFEASAGAMWEEVYPSLSEGLPGLLGAVTARAETQVLRIAIIYALLDQSLFIRPEHLLAALAVWDYCLDSARFIYGDATGNANADKILTALIESHDGMTRTDIRDLLNRNASAEEIDVAIKILDKQGLVIIKTVPTGGRPTTMYFYNGATTLTTETTKPIVTGE